MKKQILFLSISLYSIFILAQESYYDDVNLNLTGISLKEALATKIITTHTNNLSYTPGIWNAVMVTDMNPIDNSEVLLIYGFEDGSDSNSTNDRERNINDNCTSSSCTGLVLSLGGRRVASVHVHDVDTSVGVLVCDVKVHRDVVDHATAARTVHGCNLVPLGCRRPLWIDHHVGGAPPRVEVHQCKVAKAHTNLHERPVQPVGIGQSTKVVP